MAKARSSSAPDSTIAMLAKLYSIQTSYTDVHGKQRDADPESLLAVLRAMGAPLDHLDGAREALRSRKAELAARAIQPVMVAWDGKLDTADGEITLEDGSRFRGKRLPPGYHVFRRDEHESFVISAPRKAHFPFRQKQWGLFVPIYALHSKRNPAAGDLADFEQIAEWMSRLGGRVAATLPLLATFLREPFEPSPYAPASRLYWNEFYADAARIPEFKESTKAQHLSKRRARRTRFIDYKSEMEARRDILEELARTFFRKASGERRKRLEEFNRSHAGVERYARFRAVTDRLKTGWSAWPARLRNGDIRPGDYRESDRQYHLYAQWTIQEQLQSLSDNAHKAGQALYLDLPLGLHPDSFDAWSERGLFLSGVAGGAPPDLVFTKGQNWGFPAMHPDAMRLSRHKYTIAYVQNHLRFAKLLRIDHVMGLHRLYCIPDGLSGDKGVYVQYPAEELYAIFSLESHRHGAGVVGENLGTVPPAVNNAMAQHNIQQMYVVQYEATGDPAKAALRTPPHQCVASLNTHDMPPFRSFWTAEDIRVRETLRFLDHKAAVEEERQRRKVQRVLVRFLKDKGFLTDVPRTSAEAVFDALTEFLAAGPAGILLVNVEDLWQETEAQNIPSTHSEHPNWRRRMRPSVEEIGGMRAVVNMLKKISDLRGFPQKLEI